MAQYNSFNLIDLYTKVFGIKGVRFAIPTESQSDEGSIEFATPSTQVKSKAKAYSLLGAPVYEVITCKIPVNGGFKDYTFPDWPLLDVSAAKNIVKTPLKGKDGTVKEYINIDDYQITIRGILINYNSDEYPEDLVNSLHQLFKVNQEMQVTTALLNLLDIHNIVITDLKLPEVEGYSNIQPYVISALSDEPVELKIQSVANSKKIMKGL
ncbi:MAG: hypothetical protein IE931_05525 [Sphingobacteriales bacterium]|nr:hypothetical protein [Sphingobacteriales bacterium]